MNKDLIKDGSFLLPHESQEKWFNGFNLMQQKRDCH